MTFAQTQMSEAGESNPEVLSELERTLALLAFEQPQKSPFSDLLEQSHRQKVSQRQIRTKFNSIYISCFVKFTKKKTGGQ